MYYTYILKGKIDSSKYIGVTTDLKQRLQQHNWKETKSNKSKAPFVIIWYCCFNDKEIAYDFEKYLKSSSGYPLTNKHLL